MEKYRFGEYAYLDNNLLDLISVEDGYEFITDDESIIKKYNFKEKKSIYSNYISYRLKAKENIGIKAFQVRTFCKYIGGIYFIENNSEEYVLLYPTTETHNRIGLHPYDDRRALIPYNEFIKNVEEIWEERNPIKGFEFKTEPIFYLKKNKQRKILEWYVRKPLNLRKGSELWFVYEDGTEEFKSIVKENENRELIFEQVILPTFYDNSNGKITFVIDGNHDKFESFDTSILYFREEYHIKEKELYYNECEPSFFKFDLNICQLELVFSKELGTILYVNCDITQIDFLIVYQWAKGLYYKLLNE